jgi:F-type H+-transporting ATPase subunit a
MQFLAAEDLHISLKAEELFTLGPLAVTNSMVYGLITSAFIIYMMLRAAKRIKVRPGQGIFIGIFEAMTEMIVKTLESAFGSRQKAVKFAPYFGVYFIFIIFTNLLELVPWVGEGIFRASGGGDIPLFRPFTADINGTIALAVIAIIMVQILSVKEQGAKKHLQHYFSDKPLNPINFFIGLLEVFGELTRILSLSLRLFLNTAVGEILITVFASLVVSGSRTPLAVIPILMFEALVAYIQAYVFMVLAGTYLGLAISHADHDDHEPIAIKSDHHSPAELMNHSAG